MDEEFARHRTRSPHWRDRRDAFCRAPDPTGGPSTMTGRYAGSHDAWRLNTNSLMHELPYGFGKVLGEADFETAVGAVVDAITEQGFRVFTQMDLQKALKAARDVEFRRYLILGVCDPELAELALEVDPHIGLLLLCNVVVQEGAGSGLYVAVASCQPLFQLTHHPRLKRIAAETERRLRLAVEAVR